MCRYLKWQGSVSLKLPDCLTSLKDVHSKVTRESSPKALDLKLISDYQICNLTWQTWNHVFNLVSCPWVTQHEKHPFPLMAKVTVHHLFTVMCEGDDRWASSMFLLNAERCNINDKAHQPLSRKKIKKIDWGEKKCLLEKLLHFFICIPNLASFHIIACRLTHS